MYPEITGLKEIDNLIYDSIDSYELQQKVKKVMDELKSKILTFNNDKHIDKYYLSICRLKKNKHNIYYCNYTSSKNVLVIIHSKKYVKVLKIMNNDIIFNRFYAEYIKDDILRIFLH